MLILSMRISSSSGRRSAQIEVRHPVDVRAAPTLPPRTALRIGASASQDVRPASSRRRRGDEKPPLLLLGEGLGAAPEDRHVRRRPDAGTRTGRSSHPTGRRGAPRGRAACPAPAGRRRAAAAAASATTGSRRRARPRPRPPVRRSRLLAARARRRSRGESTRDRRPARPGAAPSRAGTEQVVEREDPLVVLGADLRSHPARPRQLARV